MGLGSNPSNPFLKTKKKSKFQFFFLKLATQVNIHIIHILHLNLTNHLLHLGMKVGLPLNPTNMTNGHLHNQTLGNPILIFINHTKHGNPIQITWCQMDSVKGIHFHSILSPLILLIIGIPIKPHLILWDPINSFHHLIHTKQNGLSTKIFILFLLCPTKLVSGQHILLIHGLLSDPHHLLLLLMKN